MPPSETSEEILRISSSSSVQSTGSAIAHHCYDYRKVRLRAVGAGAVNQAMKAIVAARGFAASRGMNLVCIPGMENVDGKGGEKISAMTFLVFDNT